MKFYKSWQNCQSSLPKAYTLDLFSVLRPLDPFFERIIERKAASW